MSASPSVEGQSHWKEYKNAEGRVYWSHALTKQSVWEKPDELKTPFERAITKTTWKQYTSKGKPYYVNSATKETVWNLPPELLELKEKVEADERRRAAGGASPSRSDASRAGTPDSDNEDMTGALVRRRSRTPTPEPAPRVETVTIPPGGFTTHEKAEEAFIHLLKREGVDETYTWDTTMRRIVQDPLWKALDSLAQKKSAFEKWQQQIVSEKRAAREARIAEFKPHLTRLFANSGLIKSYSTMKTANTAFAKDKYWKRAKADERREILEAHTSELRSREDKERRDTKESNIQSLTKLVRGLDITVATRWRQGHNIITHSDAFRADAQLQKMETLDILSVFDEYTHQLEKEHEEESHRKRVEYRRKARKARDSFKALLRELQDKGDLTRTSKWKDTLSKFRADERYTALLGVPGSSPLDLWMDAVDDLQLEAEERAAKVEAQLRASASAAVKLETTFAEFDALCTDAQVSQGAEARQEAFDVIHARLVRAAAELARQEDKKRRDRIDDLRYALRKVRQIEADTTYEDALPHMQELPEFKDVKGDEDRQAAYEKHIRRLKDKAAETSDAGRRGSDKEQRERERDKDRYKMDVDDEYRRRGDRDRDYSRRDHRDRDRDDYRDRDRDRDYRRDRSDRDRERERERDRDREYSRRDRDRDSHRERDPRDRERSDRERSERERSDRDRDAERRRDRDREADERDPKRRRVTPLPGGPEKESDREEGEI